MERKRKSFDYITTKVYGGKPEDKTLGIHFKAGDAQAVKMARAILQAIEYGNDIDITVFTYKLLKDGCVRITITSPIGGKNGKKKN